MVTTRSRSKGDITANSSDAAPAEPSSPQKTKKEATPKSSEKHHKLAKTTSSHFYDGEFRSGLLNAIYDTIFPLTLIIFAPPFMLFLRTICSDPKFDGSVEVAVKSLLQDPMEFFSPRWWPSPSLASAYYVLAFSLLQLILWVVLPGQWWKATVTPSGQQPIYKLNGPSSYFVTIFLFFLCGHYLKLFDPAKVYDEFGSMLVTLNYSTLFLCVLLYFKGLYYPSSSDSGSTGNPIRDFFWGTELHPTFGRWNLKQLVNCRIGMTGWIILNFCFASKQYAELGYVSNSMVVSCAIYAVYIAKFFWWEHGYFNSIDIMHDRFGFYIFWGIMNWVPGLYTIVPLYLVRHPYVYSDVYAVSIFVFGVAMIWLNYNADQQRLLFRETDGNCVIWGKKPDFIIAKYKTGDGKERENKLLVGGWWGVSRHFNYIPEILLSLAWTLPSGFNHLISWSYFIFIVTLLLHRLKRDEERCSIKYGKYWEEYKRKVPYNIVPYVI